MFKNLGNMADLFKQAQEMQKKMAQSQEKLDGILVEGTSGAGLVHVIMTAKGMVKSLQQDPTIIHPDDTEILKDYNTNAINDPPPNTKHTTPHNVQRSPRILTSRCMLLCP